MARKAAVRYAYEPDYAVPPGATLQETIDSLGMTQRELALRTGMAPKTINEIINGKAPIAGHVRPAGARYGRPSILEQPGIELPRATGALPTASVSSKRSGLARQGSNWRAGQTRRNHPQPDRPSLLHAVLRFFGVGTVEQWQQLWMQPAGSLRKSPKFAAQPEAVATWLRLANFKRRDTDPALR